MVKWLKQKIAQRLRFFFKEELQQFVKDEMKTEFRKMYAELRWQEFMQTPDADKIAYALKDNLIINLYKKSYLSPLIYRGEFENDIVSFVNMHLKAGDCFIDIGANIGFFTLLAADMVETGGLVLSFEPTADTYQKLVKNIDQNNLFNVNHFEIGLSDYEGMADFNVSHDGFDAFNSLSLPVHGNFKLETIKVDMLDNFYERVKDYKNRLWLKIDVEGWEYNVVKGAEKILKELNAILLLEFNDENTGHAPKKCTDLYSLLESYGYQLFSLADGRLTAKFNQPYFEYQNLVAIHHSCLSKYSVQTTQSLPH